MDVRETMEKSQHEATLQQQQPLDDKSPPKVMTTVSTEHSVKSVVCEEDNLQENQKTEEEQDNTVSIGFYIVTQNTTIRTDIGSCPTNQQLYNAVKQLTRADDADFILLYKGREIVNKDEQEIPRLQNNQLLYVVPSALPQTYETITVLLEKGKNLVHAFNFIVSDKVSAISQVAEQVFGIPQKHQTLFYCGGLLHNKTLQQCRIVNNCRIKVGVSSEYKKEMSKSCTFTNRIPEPVEQPLPLPQIKQLAKEVQSIDDVDDDMLIVIQQQVEPEGSLSDSFTGEPYETTITKKRSTYSYQGQPKTSCRHSSNVKSEAIDRLHLEKSEQKDQGLLLQVKEVSSIYNPDSDEWDADEEIKVCQSEKQTIRITGFSEDE